MKFAVFIVAPPGDEHWRGLEDVARGITGALQNLGHDVKLDHGTFTCLPGPERPIIFNAHRLNPTSTLPDDAIIYNAEQVRADWEKSDVGRAYLNRLRRHVVWDYSATNIGRLRQLDVERVVHCRVGYGPGTPTILSTPLQQDVDVLFFGSMNERRAMVIYDLMSKGLVVKQLFDVYGAERDQWIARSKIVLNVHFYDKPIFEIFRCAHPLANSKCVVTEGGGVDPELEALAQQACAYVTYDEIVDECKLLVRDETARRKQEDKGRQAFTAISQIDEVEKALGES